jgi:Mg-chelatase subunit ChlD
MRPQTLLTLVLLALWPLSARAHLDLVFLLDTTGSMSGEIREAKERVRELTEALRTARPNERVRVGVVAYKDKGDAYLTKVSPLSEDVEVSYQFLGTLTADGGGDTPEDVLAGLTAALRELSWDMGPDTERQVFIIADAPPHLDYPDRPKPEGLIEEAVGKRIVINAIGCRSLDSGGVEIFRKIAYATEGSYQHIGRVRAGEEGLARAMLTALAPAKSEDPSRFPQLGVTHLGAVERLTQGGLQVVPFHEGGDTSGRQQCGLQVELPPGLELAQPPVVRKGDDALHLQLSLTQGQGSSTQRYALAECTPLSMPVRVSF